MAEIRRPRLRGVWVRSSRQPSTPVQVTRTPPQIRSRRRLFLQPVRRRTPVQVPLVRVRLTVSPISAKRRPAGLLRRRLQPQVPLTQTVAVVVSVPPSLSYARRGPVGLWRRRTPVQVPLTQIVVVASSVPSISYGRRGPVGLLRRRQAVQVPIVVTVTVPSIKTGKRPSRGLRAGIHHRTPVQVPPTITVTVPPIPRPRRPFAWLRRRPPQPFPVTVAAPAVITDPGSACLTIAAATVTLTITDLRC